ncbi:MAG: MFS transporter [Nostocoides sp.]
MSTPQAAVTEQPATFADPRRWLALGVLAAGLSMIVLDGTIVGVALPRIIDVLHLDLTQAQWVNSLYSMVFAALLLFFGRIGDRFGRRTLLLIGVVVFVVGSVTAAMADGGGSLIASRALQGFGGAMVLPSTLATVNATFRGRDRATAFGVWGAVMAGMAAVGPLLGGWLTTSFDWRWIFLVNVPIGVLVLLGTLLWVPETKTGIRARGLDVDGLLTSGIGLALITFGLIEGSRLVWWRPLADFRALGLTWPHTAAVSIAPVALVVGVVSMGLFVRWEQHRARVRRDALLDLSLFTVPTFTWGNLTAAAVAAGEFALVFVLPLYLVNALGLSIMGAGLVLAAMAVGAFISGAQARHLAERLSATTVVIIGLVLEIVGAATVALLLSPSVSPWAVALPMTVYGVGLGLASAQLTSTILADIPTVWSGSASATQSSVRQVGSALGSALAGSTLAVGLGSLLPDRLAAVQGLPSGVAAALANSTSASAGGLIPTLQALGTHGQLGALGPEVTHVLAGGFADAARVSVAVAVTFLLLGLLGALQVARAARASTRAG